MTKLTTHFTLAEFTRSATALSKGIDNTPSNEAIANMRHLCEEVLEPLRDAFGEPVTVSSGYRSKTLNAAVGGSPTSQHIRGEAADIAPTATAEGKKRLKEWMRWIIDNTDFDQCIFERNSSGTCWIHVSACRDPSRNRHHVISSLKKT